MPLQLADFIPAGPAELWRLDASHMAENLGSQTIAGGDELTLPGQSISLYILP